MRSDSGVGAVLVPGAAVMLVPGGEGAAGAGGWGRVSGKTQLAVFLAESLWQSREVELLAWVNACGRASVLAGYVQAAAHLGLDGDGDAEAVAARFLGWLGSTARRWLVVMDDLRDVADVEGLVPGGPTGRVLVTVPDAAVAAGWGQVVTVPVPLFSIRESMAYLLHRLTTDPEQRSGAYELADSLGGEPLALALAGAAIAGSGTGARDYQRRLARERAAGGEPSAAAGAWVLSAALAEELLPGGGTWPLLVLAALLDGNAVPRPVLTAPAVGRYLGAGSADEAQHAGAAVAALERAGLLCTDAAVVRVSGALQAAARGAAPAELLAAAAHAAAGALAEAWPGGDPRSVLAGQVRSCAAALLRNAGDLLWDGGCHPVLLEAGRSLSAARLTGPAAAWWQDTAVRCERLLGKDHPDTLFAAGQLAAALTAAGQHAEAVHFAQWVLDCRERNAGPGSPAATTARLSLGRALAAGGEPARALAVLHEAAGRTDRAGDRGSPRDVALLEEYAEAFLAAGDPRAAVRFGQRALAGREKLHGPAGPEAQAAALRLAGACLAAGNPRAAVRHCKQVLAARQRDLGPDDPATLATRAALAGGHAAAGQIGEALREHQLTCAGYERVLGPDHPLTLERRVGLAAAFYEAGQLGDAVALLDDSIPRAEHALSPGDPVTRRLHQVRDTIADGTAAG